MLGDRLEYAWLFEFHHVLCDLKFVINLMFNSLPFSKNHFCIFSSFGHLSIPVGFVLIEDYWRDLWRQRKRRSDKLNLFCCFLILFLAPINKKYTSVSTHYGCLGGTNWVQTLSFVSSAQGGCSHTQTHNRCSLTSFGHFFCN